MRNREFSPGKCALQGPRYGLVEKLSAHDQRQVQKYLIREHLRSSSTNEEKMVRLGLTKLDCGSGTGGML